MNLLPEIWGGIECSINRVNDTFYDQNEISGHYKRPDDIALCASLGIKKLRYPILWERYQPTIDSIPDWTRAESQLHILKEHGITPIVGLVHHGSGPAFTSLDDPKFPVLLAVYAKQVAEKFPWVEHYTIVNEPLTTARFSGLYGLWYPHHKDDQAFANMLINQLKGIVLSMQAIRKINPYAKLIQTEDLGKTYSTSLLRYQADFENERRWLTFDLLCGRVTPGHRMWDYLIWAGVDEEDLYFFLQNPCPPDVMGFNYYITSERYLDESLEKYPIHTHGANTKHYYADVEAVRVQHPHPSGCENLLTEAWQRYGLPMALTEVHLNCHREDQLKWLQEIWEVCIRLHEKHIPVKAVTAWSLLGSYGWNKLLTCTSMEYEPGAFDLGSGEPRETAVGKLIRYLAGGKPFEHPLLDEKGWWHREDRYLNTDQIQMPIFKASRMLLIIGKTGTLGNAFANICTARGIPYQLIGRAECDIGCTTTIMHAINKYKPWAIMNTAGFVKVEEAEWQINTCNRNNTTGPEILASICKNLGIKFITFSSDLVFDGKKQDGYIETDAVNPLNNYGLSKATAEKKILSLDSSALIIRTSAFFGPWDKYNFAYVLSECLKNNQPFKVASDLYVSPTYLPDLVNATLDLIVDDEKDIWHVANSTAITWAGFAYKIADHTGLNPENIQAVPYSSMGLKAAMPATVGLRVQKGFISQLLIMRWQDCLMKVNHSFRFRYFKKNI